MQERLHRTGALGIDLVQAVHRLIQSDAQLDFPADAVEISHLPRADPGREIREEEAIPLRRVNPDEAEMQGVLGTPYTYICINGAAIEDEEILLEQGIEVGSGGNSWAAWPRAT